jgi:hypothetical protein
MHVQKLTTASTLSFRSFKARPGTRLRRFVCCCNNVSDARSSTWQGSDAEEWGAAEDDSSEDEVGEYFYDGFSSAGYEAAATALSFAVAAALLKLLWYLAIVCYTMIITAFQYSIVAIALIMVVVFFG